MAKMQKITPNLWFDTEAEEAADFYTSIFKDSQVVRVLRYGRVAPCTGVWSKPGPPWSTMINDRELLAHRHPTGHKLHTVDIDEQPNVVPQVRTPEVP